MDADSRPLSVVAKYRNTVLKKKNKAEPGEERGTVDIAGVSPSLTLVYRHTIPSAWVQPGRRGTARGGGRGEVGEVPHSTSAGRPKTILFQSPSPVEGIVRAIDPLVPGPAPLRRRDAFSTVRLRALTGVAANQDRHWASQARL